MRVFFPLIELIELLLMHAAYDGNDHVTYVNITANQYIYMQAHWNDCFTSYRIHLHDSFSAYSLYCESIIDSIFLVIFNQKHFLFGS